MWKHFSDSGKYNHPAITLDESEEILVESLDENNPVLLEVDGEYLGRTPAKFTILKHAIRVITP